MSSVLHMVAAAAGLGCCCKYTSAATAPHIHPRPRTGEETMEEGIHREYLFDFTWYRSWNLYAQPIVLIEHENQWRKRDFMLDFWKLCLGSAPLRVMFGYTRHIGEWEGRLEGINSTIEEQKWVLPPDTEDLIFMGHRDMHPSGFQVLVRAPGQRVFESRGGLAEPA